MIRKYILHAFLAMAAATLVLVSFQYSGSNSAILASVEPQRYAVSFQHPVKVKEIYVIPGQNVKKGDTLIKVERPDLLLESDEKEISLKTFTSQLKIKGIEKENQLLQLTAAHKLRNDEIDAELERLNFMLANNQTLGDNLKKMKLLPDTLAVIDQPYLKVRINQLEEEKRMLARNYRLDKLKIEEAYTVEADMLENQIEQLNKELELLRQEEEQLIRYAHIDGTIGNVFAEYEELASPFTTLISVYENNPTVIKALINEHQQFEINSGDPVIVESTNRAYQIEGRVEEIGSRIIEYPYRLKSNGDQQRPMWGREIFIRIPPQNNFLNGEKVFVIIGKK